MLTKRKTIWCIFVELVINFIIVVLYKYKTGFFSNQSVQCTVANIILVELIALFLLNIKHIEISFIYMSIFYFTYSFIFARYYTRRASLLFAQFETGKLYGIMIVIMLQFITTLFIWDCFTRKKSNKKSQTNISYYRVEKSNEIIEYLLIIILASSILIDPLLNMGGKFYEYSVIFEIIAIYYSNGKKKFLIPIGIISMLLMIYGFYTGIRVGSLPFALAFIFSVFRKKIKPWQMLLGTGVGIVIMTMLGEYGEKRLTGGYTFDFMATFKSLLDNGYSLDTSVFAFLCSCTFISMVGFCPWSRRLYLFSRFLLSQIFGSGISESKLAFVSRAYYVHYNGGILPYFFYFYLGFGGVLLIGIVVAKYIEAYRYSSDKQAKPMSLVKLFIIAMIPKWFLYEPLQLFRGVLILLVVYYVVDFLDRASIRKFYR